MEITILEKQQIVEETKSQEKEQQTQELETHQPQQLSFKKKNTSNRFILKIPY